MKKYTNVIIFTLIIILSIVLRLLFIDKPTGFWHNEMVMYNQTIAGSITDIINAAVQADVHFPLYQIMLAGWIKIFGNGDVTIRLFSVLAGVLTVIFGYFTGKEIKDEKTGNIFAFLTAINSTLIFYSQEVKFYIFLALYVTISLFFIVRILKYSKIKDYIGYILVNTAIIYTFTIGVLYVIAQGLVLLGYILVKKKDIIKNFLISNIIMIILISPFAYFVLTNMDKYEGANWIFTSNIYTTFVLLQNYFTPYIIGIYNNPKVYVPTFRIFPIIFIYIPIIIAFFGMFKAVKSNKNYLILFLISALFLLFEVLLCMNSGLRMLTRYTILAIPPLLLLVSIGLSEIKAKLLTIVISYLLVINGFFLIFSPESAVRGYRDLGEKPVADVLIDNNITDNDVFVLALRKNDFDKYIEYKGGRFSLLQDFVHEPYAMDNTKLNGHDKYIKYVLNNEQINKKFEQDFYKRVIKPLTKGSRVFYIWDENYNSYPIKTEQDYRIIPVMTGSLSRMNAEAFMICDKYLKIRKGIKLKYFRIFIFEKI